MHNLDDHEAHEMRSRTFYKICKGWSEKDQQIDGMTKKIKYKSHAIICTLTLAWTLSIQHATFVEQCCQCKLLL